MPAACATIDHRSPIADPANPPCSPHTTPQTSRSPPSPNLLPDILTASSPTKLPPQSPLPGPPDSPATSLELQTSVFDFASPATVAAITHGHPINAQPPRYHNHLSS
ncbi:Uncharacterized protein M6B38_240350 [Iris pallida]|uniref:Uncharacterized protein n=1 Tax=Iris pallida TaxID=29817 RepID=A0AAX6DKI2_IRIPA|nr:Uncharacterized protein M6B38_240350 [Iris pallida]